MNEEGAAPAPEGAVGEQIMVRARDLRPGDVVIPDYCIVSVEPHGRTVAVITQRPGRKPVLGVCLADGWLRLAQEGP